MFKRLVLTTLIVLISCVGAQAAKRLGLVIGNDNYTHVAVLEKARSDAIAISETLSQLDFDITQVLDADRREMNRAIASFVAKLQPGDTALVFYAGHGVEIVLEKLYRAQIDGHLDGPDPLVQPCFVLAAGFVQYPFADPNDHPGLFGHRQPVARLFSAADRDLEARRADRGTALQRQSACHRQYRKRAALQQ